MDRKDRTPAPRLSAMIADARRGQKVAADVEKGDDSSRGSDDLSPDSSYLTTPLFRSLRPLITCMRLVGMGFSRTKRGNLDWRFYYSLLMLLVLLAVFVRSLSVYEEGEQFGPTLFGKIQWMTLSFQCLAITLSSIHGFYSESRIPAFFTAWDLMLGDRKASVCPRNALFLSIAFPTALVFVHTIGLILAFFVMPELRDLLFQIIWSKTKEGSGETAIKVLITFAFTLNAALSFLSASFQSLLCFLVVREFRSLNSEFDGCITKDGRLLTDLDKSRLRHQNLCSLVDILDLAFSSMISIVFLCDITNFCVTFYNLIYFEGNGYQRALFLFWLVSIAMHITTVAVSTAMVNVAAHGLLPSLFKIRVTEAMKYYEMEMMMFLSQLTGREIGLTPWKMFVVTRKTILTIFGLLITYFVLLLQLRDSANAAHASVPCLRSGPNNNRTAYHR